MPLLAGLIVTPIASFLGTLAGAIIALFQGAALEGDLFFRVLETGFVIGCFVISPVTLIALPLAALVPRLRTRWTLALIGMVGGLAVMVLLLFTFAARLNLNSDAYLLVTMGIVGGGSAGIAMFTILHGLRPRRLVRSVWRGDMRAPAESVATRRQSSYPEPLDLSSPGEWQPVHIGLENDGFSIDGVDIWSAQWDALGVDSVMLPHPAHPEQTHRFDVYRAKGPVADVLFAAGELSNGVWGFYVPSDRADTQIP